MAAGKGTHGGERRRTKEPDGTLTLCALFTLRYESPYLLPWLTLHFLSGVDVVNLYHDDSSSSWDPQLLESHAGIVKALRSSKRVNLLSMRELNLTNQEDQLMHCDQAAAAATPCDTSGGSTSWVGNWDVDEAPAGGLSNHSCSTDNPNHPCTHVQLKKLLQALPSRVLAVPVPRAVMSSEANHDLPSEDSLEYEQYGERRYFSTKGKSIWRAGCHVHPTFSGHLVLARKPDEFAFAGGSSVETRELGYDEDDMGVPVSAQMRRTNAGQFKAHWVTGEMNAAPPSKHGEKSKATAKAKAEDDTVLQGSMYTKASLHHRMADGDATLPGYAVDFRLNHYSSRSLTECARKAAFSSSGHDIFGSSTIRNDRCKRADFLDEKTMRSPDITLSKFGDSIREGVVRFFGEEGMRVLQHERKWYRQKLKDFTNGGSPNF